jgi:hypothetical protein
MVTLSWRRLPIGKYHLVFARRMDTGRVIGWFLCARQLLSGKKLFGSLLKNCRRFSK